MNSSLAQATPIADQKPHIGKPTRSPASHEDIAWHYTTPPARKVYLSVLGPRMPGATESQIVAFGKFVSAFVLYQVRHRDNPLAICVEERELRRRIGKQWLSLCGHLIIRGPTKRFNYSDRGKNCTREFSVFPEVAEAVNDAMVRKSWPPLELVRSDDKRMYKTDSAVVGGKNKGKHGHLNVPPSFEINTTLVKRYVDVCESWLVAAETSTAAALVPEEYRRRKEQQRAVQAHMPEGEFYYYWIRWVANKLVRARAVDAIPRALNGDGLFHQTYAQTNGKPRFTGQGKASLQGVQRELRYAALDGYWSYDIEACHHKILQWFAQSAGIKCPALDAYVLNRDNLRLLLAAALGHDDTDAVKKALLIIVYGGRFQRVVRDDSKEWALRELLGEQGQETLYNHPDFKRLHKELKLIFKHIVDSHKPKNGHKGQYQNVLLQFLPPTYTDDDGKTRKTSKAQIVAFVLQAIECKAMAAMVEASATPLVAIHDGIVTRDKADDMAVLVEAMTEATGIVFKLEESQIEAPKWLA